MSRSFAHARRALLLLPVVYSVAASAAAHAQARAANAPLTLGTAIELTLARNPSLESFGFRLAAQHADIESAGLTPPLELRAEIEDAFGTGRTSGLDTAEATFSLARVLELGGKRARRTARAEAALDLVEVERAAAELDVLAEVTRRFIHVAADQELLALTQRATALAEDTVRAAAERVTAARAPEVELRRAHVTLARAQVEREHAEHELLSSRRKLAAMWGDAELGRAEVAADLFRLPAPDSFDDLLARVESSPDLLRFASAARLRDAEIRAAEAEARANIVVAAGVKQLQQGDDRALVLGITMPLGSARRAAPEVAQSTARRAEVDAELAAHRVQVEAQLFELYQELGHALTEAEILRAQVIPEMEAALTATRSAFDRGRYSYLEWVDAQRELVDVQRALIDAAANAHLFRAEIERLTAEPVTAE